MLQTGITGDAGSAIRHGRTPDSSMLSPRTRLLVELGAHGRKESDRVKSAAILRQRSFGGSKFLLLFRKWNRRGRLSADPVCIQAPVSTMVTAVFMNSNLRCDSGCGYPVRNGLRVLKSGILETVGRKGNVGEVTLPMVLRPRLR